MASLRTSDDEIVSEGKCLSISDAIGRRLRDGDKIRYKVSRFFSGRNNVSVFTAQAPQEMMDIVAVFTYVIFVLLH